MGYQKSFISLTCAKKSRETIVLELQTNLSAGGTGGQGAAPSHFGRSANHIPTRGADYAHHITTRPPSPPGFSDLPTDLTYIPDPN